MLNVLTRISTDVGAGVGTPGCRAAAGTARRRGEAERDDQGGGSATSRRRCDARHRCGSADAEASHGGRDRNVPAPVASRLRETTCVSAPSDTPAVLEVVDRGRRIAFTFDDLMRYHGPGSPAGVAHGFKVLERGLPLLDPAGPVERREVVVTTAFGGPGARDAFEAVTRAVTECRYTIDPAVARPERGRTLERFVFRLAYRGIAVTLTVRAGYVPDELIDLARREHRTAVEERRLDAVKRETAALVMGSAAADVYDVVTG